MSGSKPINHTKKIAELFKKLKANERKQDTLREKEAVIRIKLQSLYNQRAILDKGREIS